MGRASCMQTSSDADMMCNVTINVSSAFRHKVALDPRRQCRLSTCTISHLMELPIGPDILLPHSHRLVRLLDAECLHLCRVLLQHFGTIRKFDEGRGLRGGVARTQRVSAKKSPRREGRRDRRFDSNLRRLRRDLFFFFLAVQNSVQSRGQNGSPRGAHVQSGAATRAYSAIISCLKGRFPTSRRHEGHRPASPTGFSLPAASR